MVVRRKKREGLEEQDVAIANILPSLPTPRGPSQIVDRLLPKLFLAMKEALIKHSVVVEEHPSLATGNIGLYGISEATALVLLDVPPRVFLLLCWYGGESYQRLPCRTLNPYRVKRYINSPLHTDQWLWFKAYKRLDVDRLVDLLIDELQVAYRGKYYSIMFISREVVKAWVLERKSVTRKKRRKLRR